MLIAGLNYYYCCFLKLPSTMRFNIRNTNFWVTRFSHWSAFSNNRRPQLLTRTMMMMLTFLVRRLKRRRRLLKSVLRLPRLLARRKNVCKKECLSTCIFSVLFSHHTVLPLYYKDIIVTAILLRFISYPKTFPYLVSWEVVSFAWCEAMGRWDWHGQAWGSC